MRNVFLFSGKIRPFLKRISFAISVFPRLIKTLFRRKRAIKCIYLDYANKHVFQNAYFIIRFRFENALWIKISGRKKTSDSGIVILDLENISESSISLTVQGFFQKKTYHIPVNKEYKLNTNRFKVRLDNIEKIQNDFKKIKHPVLRIEVRKPDVKLTDIKVCFPNIKFSPTTYNQNELL